MNLVITNLHDFDLGHILTTLVDTVKAEGYTVRKINKAPQLLHDKRLETFERYSARHDERGVKYSFEISTITDRTGSNPVGKNVTIEMEARDNRGRYRRGSGCDRIRLNQLSSHQWFGSKDGTWRSWLGDLITKITVARGQEVTDPLLTAANGLVSFPPLYFDALDYVWDKGRGGHDIVKMSSLYRSCRVQGMVTILPNLKIDIEGTVKPGAEPWFFIIGEGMSRESNALIEIVVREQDDTLVYYPVRNKRISNDLKPLNTYIDYSMASQLDRVLIEKAIAKFLEGVNGN